MTRPDSLVTIEKRGKLWIITGHYMSNEGVDAWAEAVLAYRQAVAPSTERYLVYDSREVNNMGLTSYLRQRAAELAESDRDATGRVAIVFTVPRLVIHIFDMFTAITGKRHQPNLEVRFFQDREAAIAWVGEGMPADSH